MPWIRSSRRLALLVMTVALATPVAAQARIPAAEALAHVGEHARVCGEVESSRYAAQERGGPTFLDFGGPYPEQSFTVVVWGAHRGRFEAPPETLYRRRELCVTGKISDYRGKAQMVVKGPDQVEVVSDGGAPQGESAPGKVAGECRLRSECCRVCRKGKACGDSCISRRYTCRKARGCACDAAELCA